MNLEWKSKRQREREEIDFESVPAQIRRRVIVGENSLFMFMQTSGSIQFVRLLPSTHLIAFHKRFDYCSEGTQKFNLHFSFPKQ